MKKLLFTTIVLISFIVATQAQIGLKAGVNLASLNQEDVNGTFENIEDGSIVGFQTGLVFRYPIINGLHIQPELIYTQKGGKQNFEEPALDRKTSIKTVYHYLVMPIMAQYYFEYESAGVFFEGGTFIGIALDGEMQIETELGSATFEEDIEIDFSDEDNQKRLDFGFGLGVGYKINDNLAINIRYTFGIISLLDEDANNNNTIMTQSCGQGFLL